MIIHGSVTSIDTIHTNDGAKLYQLRFRDVSKPMETRTQGEFITYLTEDKRKALPSGDEIDEAKLTFVVKKMAGADGGIKVNGQLLPGIVSADKIGAPGQLPTKPVGKAA
jgi:hypothetical protein